MHDFDQRTLRIHYRVDVLVRHRNFIDHLTVLTAFDVRSGPLLVGDGESTARLISAHRPVSAVAVRTK